jgi:hypothetical protein
MVEGLTLAILEIAGVHGSRPCVDLRVCSIKTNDDATVIEPVRQILEGEAENIQSRVFPGVLCMHARTKQTWGL